MSLLAWSNWRLPDTNPTYFTVTQGPALCDGYSVTTHEKNTCKKFTAPA